MKRLLISGLVVVTGFFTGCKKESMQTSSVKDVPVACQALDNKVKGLKAELAAFDSKPNGTTGTTGSTTSTSTSTTTDRPGVISESECSKGDGIMRGDQCTCDSGEVMEPAKGEFCDNGQWVEGLANLPIGGYFNRKTCMQNGGEYDVARNGCKCFKGEMIYNTFDIRQWCETGRPGSSNSTSTSVASSNNPVGASLTSGVDPDGGDLVPEEEGTGFSLTLPRTKAEVEKELSEATAQFDACVKLNSGTAGQTGTTDPQACGKGGKLVDGTCYCSNGVPVFKIRNESCEQHLARQVPACTQSGGAVVWDDNVCRCRPDYNEVPAGGKCQTPFAFPGGTTSTSTGTTDGKIPGTTSVNAGQKGACVVFEKATKIVQATCFEGKTQAECDENFKMIYEVPAPGKYQTDLVANVGCEDGRKQVTAKLGTGSSGSSGSASTGTASKCICTIFKQSKSNSRFCLVARKQPDNSWKSIAQLSMATDCKAQCSASTGPAADALKSAACTN